MFTKIAGAFVAFFALSVVNAVPLSAPSLASRGALTSFNNYGGISSLSNFDDFYGSDNFANKQFSEAKITVLKEKTVVCRSQSAKIIQQRLLVLQEIAKRIITEQICEVETQTIIFEQFHSSLGGFGGDLRRHSGRDVGYDSSIASHLGSIVHQDGSLSDDDLGFSGKDLGKGYAVATGNNWDDKSSPSSVEAAWKAARTAAQPDQKKSKGKKMGSSSADAQTTATQPSASAYTNDTSAAASATSTEATTATTSEIPAASATSTSVAIQSPEPSTSAV